VPIRYNPPGRAALGGAVELIAAGDTQGDPAHAAALALVAAHVDAAFYLARYADVAAAGADALEHYWRTGWREGRDPNPWFHTADYLRANPDVRAAGVNPLWHFIAQGRHEGRSLRPAGGTWRAALDRLVPAAERPAPWTALPDAPVLDAAALAALLAAGCGTARGLVVALSHDRYPEVPGGTQLLVADEQRKFNGDNAVYLHLSPVAARLGLAPASPEPHWLNVILDGTTHGIATAGAATVALGRLPAELPRILVVHALHGHRPEAVAALARALRPAAAFYWVHDYGAACGNPRLLRNDIAFCHAPPPDSMACRVCIHGDDRNSHLQRMRTLFEAVPFDVVAPSPLALAQWQSAVALPARSLRVHPHARLDPLPAHAADDGGPARVAFIGQAIDAKGWGSFQELVAAARDLAGLRLFQFASPAELVPLDGVAAVPAETSAREPFGMTRALADHRIDLVLALSPYPETFGYAAHEALAAGADLVALAAAGNIADLVRRSGRGVVLEDTAAVLAFFTTAAAEAHVRGMRATGRQPAALVHCGSTATIVPDGGPAPITADPDLHLRIAGTRLDGVQRDGVWRFALPAPRRGGAHDVRLRSRHFLPLWDSASAADRRRLGVAVDTLRLDGAPVPPGDPRRTGGWHAAEDRWQWTDGDAGIATGAAAVLEVTLVPMARYWRAPLFAA